MKKNKVYIFGGTFDPFTEANLSVIRSLQMLPGITIIAPTTANPDKSHPPAPLNQRIQMIRLILNYENIPTGDMPIKNILVAAPETQHVHISDYPYERTVDFLDWWRNNNDCEPIWVISEDLQDSYHNWMDWKKRGCEVMVLPIVHNIHATDVRAGREPYHPAIREFIKIHQLYPSATANDASN